MDGQSALKATKAVRLLGHIALVGTVVAAGFAVWFGSDLLQIRRGSLSAIHIPLTPDGRRPLRFVDLTRGRSDTVTLSFDHGPAILLVYSHSCAVCMQNMPRWLDMVTEMRQQRPDAAVYAIGFDEDTTASAFWRTGGLVRILRPLDREAFVKQFQVPGTPTTMAIARDGKRTILVGTVGSWRRAYVRDRLGS